MAINKQTKNFLLYGVLLIVAGFALVHTMQVKKEIQPELPVEKTQSIQDAVHKIETLDISTTDLSRWDTYSSEKIGISFKYPPYMFVDEGDIEGVHSIRVYDDTPENHEYVKNLSKGEPPSSYIGIGSSVMTEPFNSKEFMKRFDESVIGREIEVLGNPGMVYTGHAKELFDGVIVTRDMKQYGFGVSYKQADDIRIRNDFYSLLSTLTFVEQPDTVTETEIFTDAE